MLLLVLAQLACTPGKETGETSGDDTGLHDSAHTGETDEIDDTSEPDELGARVHEALDDALATDIGRANMASGASVAVWIDGQIIAFGVGDRHPDDGGEITADTLFQIGSDTKKMTAIAALQQVQAGRLSLDETMTDALPGFAFSLDTSWADEATLHDLLSHQSGFYDYTPWDSAPDDSELYDRAYGRFAENEWLMAPPGVFWNYANPAFSIIGLETQEADGRAWPDILAEDIWAPLGMTRTFGRLSEVAADGDYATGNGVILLSGGDSFDSLSDDASYEIGTLEMADQVDNGFTRPAGLVWSTATDQMKLAQFLVNGDDTVLSDELREQVTTEQVQLYPTVPGQYYGYGMILVDGMQLGRDYYETPLWIHGGNTLTMTSTFYILPEQQFGISILSNGYGDDFSKTLQAALTSLVELPDPSDGPTYEDVGDLADYVGTWNDPYALGDIVLTTDDSSLFISIPVLDELEIPYDTTLTPAIKDLFYLTVDGATYDLTFIDGADGTPHQYLRNRSFVGVRTDIITAHPRPISRAELRARLLQARASGPPDSLRALLPGALGAPFRDR